MKGPSVIVVGGGAAGFFAAVTCAEAAPYGTVTVLERSGRFLDKVRISGGGRCNVTHACFDPHELAAHYPRGGRELVGPFHRFQPRDTVAWFEARGVKLKVEDDGRMFPVTDSSRTVIDCLLGAARDSGVQLRTNCGVRGVSRDAAGGFRVVLAGGETLACDRLLLATGGCRTPAGGELVVSLGHTLEPPVPSLFTFELESPWVGRLAGITVDPVELSLPEAKLRERGGLLLTHRGLSGPAVLRLSAWGARALHARGYRFPLRVNWLPDLTPAMVSADLRATREAYAARRVVNAPLSPLPARLWEQLVLAAGVPAEARWAGLSRAQQHRLGQVLTDTELAVKGKSTNKDEFVTCGGVRLAEVNFKSMESRICAGLHFAGELLDIDGLTGGFNFQAAWTTGWIAGRAMASSPVVPGGSRSGAKEP